MTSPTADIHAALVREVLTHHMLELSGDAMFVLSADNRITVANRAAERLGWTRQQLVGRHWDDVLVTNDQDCVRVVASDVARSAPGVATSQLAGTRRRDGQVDPVQLIVYRLTLTSGGSPTVVIARTRSGPCATGPTGA